MAISQTDLAKIYLAYFGRPVDASGLSTFANMEIGNVIGAFDSSKESQDLYGVENDTIKINAIYNNLFGRDAEPEGLKGWLARLASGEVTPASAALEILNRAQNSDKAAIEKKIAASVEFTNELLKDTGSMVGYSGNAAAAVAREWLSKVNAETDMSKVTAEINAAVKSVAIGGAEGKTFALTKNVDVLTGTSGNDTFIADLGQEAVIGAGDTIDGGAGVDTLKIYSKDTAAKVEEIAKPAMTSIEQLYIQGGTLTAGATLDVSTLAGVESVELDGATVGATGIIKTSAAQAVKLSNLVAAGDSALTLSAATKATVSNVKSADTSKAVTLDVASATATAFALTAAGAAASVVTLANAGAKLETLTVAGNKGVTVSTALTALKTVDASANSAGVTLKQTGASDLTVKGGAGNDRFEIASFNDKDVVDGGAGKDTLAITLADAAAFTKAAAVTNVEVLAVTGDTTAAATLNADYFGVNSFEIVGAIKHNVTLSNLANNGTVQLDTDSGAAATLTVDVKGAIAGTNDVLNLTTDKDGADLAANKVTVLANGVETINIASSSEAGAGAFKLGDLTSAQLKTITITGVGDVSVAGVTAAALSSIDASAAKGAVTISAASSTAAVTFKGGEGIDTYTASTKGDSIFGSKGADQITLGTGADKLVYSAADQSNATAKDTVASFNVNADLIQFAASLQTGTAVFTGTTAFSATAGKTQIGFTDTGNTSDLQVDFDGNGTVDFVVTLTGVTAADFGAANFVFA